MSFKWPWVSRYRLEDAERRLTAADQERLRLLDLLLDGRSDRNQLRTMVAQSEVPPSEFREEPESNQAPVSIEQYSTPFDRIEARFEQARKSVGIDKRFMARVS
jgi:hypothetical protein